MGDASAQDLLSLDREVAVGWTALARWREGLAREPDMYADDDPLEPVRRVTGKSILDALTALSPSVADLPLRDALKRWVVALLQARIGHRDEVAWARAAAESRGLLDGKRPRKVSWREAWRGIVSASTPQEAGLWLSAAADLGPKLAELVRARAARRVELAHRLGADHPWALLLPVDRGVLRNIASRLLDATEDLARAVWKPALGGPTGMAAVIHGAVGRDAGEGWPAALTARWLQDTFGTRVRGLRIELTRLPLGFGAASFARALYVFGCAVRASAPASAMPFALAHEPGFVGAHRFGFVFGGLPADAEWQRRVLGVGRGAALAQSRILARSALFDTRLHAARLLLGDDASLAPRDSFEELGARLFEGGIMARLRGAWPAARDDEPARFVGLLESRGFANDLRDRFDSDWYRNPRAWAHLRGLGMAPANESIDAQALAAQVEPLARAFDGALG